MGRKNAAHFIYCIGCPLGRRQKGHFFLIFLYELLHHYKDSLVAFASKVLDFC